MSNHGFHLITGGKAVSSRSAQPTHNAPLIPTREAILDLYLDHWTVPEIAMKTRTSGATVQAVIATYMEQYMRQTAALMLQAGPAERVRAKEVAAEVWSEYGMTRRAA